MTHRERRAELLVGRVTQHVGGRPHAGTVVRGDTGEVLLVVGGGVVAAGGAVLRKRAFLAGADAAARDLALELAGRAHGGGAPARGDHRLPCDRGGSRVRQCVAALLVRVAHVRLDLLHRLVEHVILCGRFHPQFLDKNRLHIGKYQSTWTDSKMETPGSRSPRGRSEWSWGSPGPAAPALCRTPHWWRGRRSRTPTRRRSPNGAPCTQFLRHGNPITHAQE
jgi:hypothetical protein